MNGLNKALPDTPLLELVISSYMKCAHIPIDQENCKMRLLKKSSATNGTVFLEKNKLLLLFGPEKKTKNNLKGVKSSWNFVVKLWSVYFRSTKGKSMYRSIPKPRQGTGSHPDILHFLKKKKKKKRFKRKSFRHTFEAIAPLSCEVLAKSPLLQVEMFAWSNEDNRVLEWGRGSCRGRVG